MSVVRGLSVRGASGKFPHVCRNLLYFAPESAVFRSIPLFWTGKAWSGCLPAGVPLHTRNEMKSLSDYVVFNDKKLARKYSRSRIPMATLYEA